LCLLIFYLAAFAATYEGSRERKLLCERAIMDISAMLATAKTTVFVPKFGQ